MAAPNVQDGIEYWETQPASLDGVLGGYGSGTLPRIDALGSRQFLLHLLPELSTVPSAIRPLSATPPARRTRALDVGAGIGRVTSDVLLHLVADVVLVEPVGAFVQAALARARAGTPPWRGLREGATSVAFVQSTLQALDPGAAPAVLAREGAAGDDLASGFDVVWCQWCLGHLGDGDLVAFLRRAGAALRGPRSVVVVKENVCSDGAGGVPRTVFDEQDSSLTRSDLAWKAAFAAAGLTLVRQKVQEGLPEGLYTVKM